MEAKQIIQLAKKHGSIELETRNDLLVIYCKCFGGKDSFLFELNGRGVADAKTEKTAIKKTQSFLDRGFDVSSEECARILENSICAENGVLIKENGSATAEIIDPELDVIKCEFAGDDCVVIDTKEWNYLTLSEENLNQLQDLINEAREYYEDEHRK